MKPRYFIGMVAVLVAGSAAFGWLVDPINFYRPAKHPSFSDHQRLQNLGLALTHDYDTAIIGTSTADGMRPSYLAPRFKAVKLALDGGSLVDAKLMIDYAVATGKPKTIIWALDTFLFSNPAAGPEWPVLARAFLHKRWDRHLMYLFSEYTLTTALKSIVGVRQHADLDALNVYNSQTASVDKLRADHKAGLHPSRLQSMQHWRVTQDSTELNTPNIDSAIIETIAANPGIKFVIYFTPVSLRRYSTIDAKTFAYEARMKRYITDKILERSNARLHDFQCLQDIVADDARYIDLVHYNDKTNQYIAESLLKGRHSVRPGNASDCIDELARLALERGAD